MSLTPPPSAHSYALHKKTGGLYSVLAASASMQTNEPIGDHAAVVVYRSVADGSVWVRPADEFDDGRFSGIVKAMPYGIVGNPDTERAVAEAFAAGKREGAMEQRRVEKSLNFALDYSKPPERLEPQPHSKFFEQMRNAMGPLMRSAPKLDGTFVHDETPLEDTKRELRDKIAAEIEGKTPPAHVSPADNVGKPYTIHLTKEEVQSQLNRVRYAEMLIEQLPVTHDGRNTWLLNYGVGPGAMLRRRQRGKGEMLHPVTEALGEPYAPPAPEPKPEAWMRNETLPPANEIERIAKALAAECHGPSAWGIMSDLSHQHFRRQAMAAKAAMNPVEEPDNRIWSHPTKWSHDVLVERYQNAMDRIAHLQNTLSER